MKRIFISMFLIVSSMASAKTYYVSTTGKDTNPGTISQPWGTVQYAFNNTPSGDTCYFRGGTWYVTGPIGWSGHNGTHDNPTCFFAYPDDFAAGNRPILDFRNDNRSVPYKYGMYWYNASYIYFKGLTWCNLTQVNEQAVIAVNMYLCDGYIKYEQCVNHNNSGRGFLSENSDTILYYNCDAYANCDTLTTYDPGGGASGFSYHNNKNEDSGAWESYVLFKGCRGWDCSDQAWGGGSDGLVEWDSCWAMRNGFHWYGVETEPTVYGDYGHNGSGWKTELTWNPDRTKVIRYMHNCLAFDNEYMGIAENEGGKCFQAHYYNNFVYRNGYPHYMGVRAIVKYNLQFVGKDDTIGRYNRWYRNNISYKAGVDGSGTDAGVSGVSSNKENNFWNSNLTVTNEDFVSLDTTGMIGVHTRQADGSLPYTQFGHLASTSNLIDAGTINTGLPYTGAAPDVGWVESGSASTTPTAPVYISSVIENATPSRVDMNFSLSLANIVPPTPAFSVKVNSVTRSVSSVSISGTKVLLTLSSPVVYGNVITVAYTKSASNPLQTAAGGQAASISAQTVTNKCIAPVNQPPVINITSPGKSSSFTAPATITLDANATDPDGTITKVEFFNGSTKLAELISAPYTYTWKDIPAGTYSFTAAATDNLNSRSISAIVTVIVNNLTASVNQLPSVSISSPADKSSITTFSSVLIAADASDADGNISKVEFYIGNSKIGESITPPYSVPFEFTKAGTYEITATATDNLNAVTKSSSVTLYATLAGKKDAIALYPNPNDGLFTISLADDPLAEEYSVIITTLKGKTVYTGVLLNEENTRHFNLSYLDSGVYIMMISGNKIFYTKKFVKK